MVFRQHKIEGMWKPHTCLQTIFHVPQHLGLKLYNLAACDEIGVRVSSHLLAVRPPPFHNNLPAFVCTKWTLNFGSWALKLFGHIVGKDGHARHQWFHMNLGWWNSTTGVFDYKFENNPLKTFKNMMFPAKCSVPLDRILCFLRGWCWFLFKEMFVRSLRQDVNYRRTLVLDSWFRFDRGVNAGRSEHCCYCCVWICSLEQSRRSTQNIAEHILWIPSFSKLNIAAHALSLKWIILWFVRWPDGVLQTPRLETKATLVWQEIYNFVCVGNGLTFGNGWSDKTVHKETLFW